MNSLLNPEGKVMLFFYQNRLQRVPEHSVVLLLPARCDGRGVHYRAVLCDPEDG